MWILGKSVLDAAFEHSTKSWPFRRFHRGQRPAGSSYTMTYGGGGHPHYHGISPAIAMRIFGAQSQQLASKANVNARLAAAPASTSLSACPNPDRRSVAPAERGSPDRVRLASLLSAGYSRDSFASAVTNWNHATRIISKSRKGTPRTNKWTIIGAKNLFETHTISRFDAQIG
jgi:hypothetical protein